MGKKDYCMSFTAASLMFSESIKIVDLYLQTLDWTQIRSEVLSDNLLKKRVGASTKRQCDELLKLLRNLSDTQLQTLSDASLEDQKYILWLAICKTYPFLSEFSIQVVYEKFLSMSYTVSLSDVISFNNMRSLEHEQLADFAKTTIKKLHSSTLLSTPPISGSTVSAPYASWT